MLTGCSYMGRSDIAQGVTAVTTEEKCIIPPILVKNKFSPPLMTRFQWQGLWTLIFLSRLFGNASPMLTGGLAGMIAFFGLLIVT